GAISAGMACMSIIVGRAVDSFGVKTLLAGGCVISGLVTALAARADSFTMLFGFLVLVGWGSSTCTPAGTKGVGDWFPYSQRAFAIGVRQTGVAAGAFIAALLLPAIAFGYGWQGALVVAGLLAALGGVACAVLYKNRPASRAPVQ